MSENWYNKGGDIIIKKLILVFILIGLFYISLSHFTNAFSQSNIKLRAIEKDGTFYIRILTPVTVKSIYSNIYTKEGESVAVVYKDYYGIIEEMGTEYNEFIISNKEVNFTQEHNIKILPNRENSDMIPISSIPTSIIEPRDQFSGETIKVMTYNIHHGRDKIGLSNIADIRELIKKEKPDIVGLQEVDKNMIRTSFEDQVLEITKELPMYNAFGENEQYFKGLYGNAILSRYPILNWQNIRLEGKEKRGLLRATILVENEKINYMVTHLGLDTEEREKQLKVISTYMDIYNDNLIVVGDFNTDDYDSNIVDIQKKMKDAARETHNKYIHTLNVFNNKKRIDYIFLDKNNINVKGYRVLKEEYSDHFPVLAEVELN